ncbi:MAG: DUF883 C-terminal domain-containing protein [Alphaproteobacteria bacterium]|nr:DUF883 C-terminal domain-containing protein [Alphaproteobacteria bacterium]
MYESTQRESINGKAEHIRKTAARTARHLQDDADDAVSSVVDAVNVVKEDLGDLAQQAGRRVRHVIDEAEGSATRVANGMTAAVRENPVQSSLIALGVGAVIGMLMRR